MLRSLSPNPQCIAVPTKFPTKVKEKHSLIQRPHASRCHVSPSGLYHVPRHKQARANRHCQLRNPRNNKQGQPDRIIHAEREKQVTIAHLLQVESNSLGKPLLPSIVLRLTKMRPPDAQLPDTSHFTSQPHARQLQCSENVRVCAPNTEIWIAPKKPHCAQIHKVPSQQKRQLTEPATSRIKGPAGC